MKGSSRRRRRGSAGFAVGIVFAVISYFLYYVAVILVGAALGYTLGAGLMIAIGLDGFLSTSSGSSVAQRSQSSCS